MQQIIIDILSALAISVVISVMSKLHNQRAKALLYSVPIPITIALIGSKSVAGSLNISGLMLTTLFLWGCYYFHIKHKKNILVVDVMLSIFYVLTGYILVHVLHIQFLYVVAIYLASWLLCMYLFSKRSFDYTPGKVNPTNVWTKGLIIFVLAFLLFTARVYLAAFVVTFPYNGVFAVFENKAGLYPQAALFTRNSLALLAYFVANHYAGHHFGTVLRYVLSWVAFGLVLFAVNKFVKIRVEQGAGN